MCECLNSSGDSSLGRHRPSGGREASARTTSFRSPGGVSSGMNPLGIHAFKCQEFSWDSRLGRHRPSGTSFRSPGGASSGRNPLGFQASIAADPLGVERRHTALPVSAPLGEFRVVGILWGFKPRSPPTFWGSRGVTPHYQFPLPWGSFECQESFGVSNLGGHRIKC